MSSFFILTLLQYLFAAGHLITIYNMKKFALLVCLLFSFPAVASAQIYTAGSGYYPQEPSVIFPWEISLGLTGAYSPVKETDGERLLNWQGGVSARALYYLTPWFGVGPEGSWLVPLSANSFVDKYTVLRGGLAGKFVSASDTATRSYAILSAGVTRRKAEYAVGLEESKKSSYFAFGVGIETDVADACFIGLEIRGIYNTSTKLGRISYLTSRWEAEASLRVGMRF